MEFMAPMCTVCAARSSSPVAPHCDSNTPPAICYRFRTMKITRRAALKSSALAASALALDGPRIFSQASASVDAHIDILPGEPIATISPEIYSHFIEHLGGVIYDGVWVGPESKIANTNGIRQAFIDTMRAIQAPLLRWPGGCFADSYDWRDGLGAAANRPARTGFWGQQDPNRFGLHEFMHTCRAIGCKPYLAADMRSLPARDFYQEIEYCNAPAGLVAVELRRARHGGRAGRPARGKRRSRAIQCGPVGRGQRELGMRRQPAARGVRGDVPQIYRVDAELQQAAAALCRRRGEMATTWTGRGGSSRACTPTPNGATSSASPCTTTPRAVPRSSPPGDALEFNTDDYYDLLTRASIMERIVTDHWAAITETAQPGQNAVKLVVDEWGAWYGKGTSLGPEYNLSQQSTMRDALLTGITLDIFQRHADKVAVAAVAQSINCIHSLMLAQGDKFTVTPTFHVFQMYMPHRGAQAVRAEFSAPAIRNPLANAPIPVGGNSYTGSLEAVKQLAGLSGSASISPTNPKLVTLTVVNPHIDQPVTAEIAVGGAASPATTARCLRSRTFMRTTTSRIPTLSTRRRSSRPRPAQEG